MTTLTQVPKKVERADAINSTTWVAWLDTLKGHDAEGNITYNKRRLTESQSRAVHRWKHQGDLPSLWSADRLACAIGCHIDEFFGWADEKDLPSWMYSAPWFETSALTEEDLRQIERTWRELHPAEPKRRSRQAQVQARDRKVAA